MISKNPRVKNDAHLAFIRTLPCVCCLNNIETQAAHIRFSDARVCKDNAGIGAKPSDCWTVPLCGTHHTQQHNVGDERAFWESYGIDPINLAMALYCNSGNYDAGTRLVAQAARECA